VEWKFSEVRTFRIFGGLRAAFKRCSDGLFSSVNAFLEDLLLAIIPY
jgi:hypothetical protein